MDNNPSKPEATASSGDKKRSLIAHLTAQLAMALGQTIPAERVLLYVRALSDLSETQLLHGFEQALKLFRQDFGKTFPLPSEIRDWAGQWRPKAENTRLLLERGDKPADWEPMTKAEAKAFIDSIRTETRKK